MTFTIYNYNVLLLDMCIYILYNNTEYNYYISTNNVPLLCQRSLCIIAVPLLCLLLLFSIFSVFILGSFHSF